MTIETTGGFLPELEERRNRVEGFLVAAHELRGLGFYERIEVVEDVTAFLAETLIPHADAAEGVLFEAADSQSLAFDRQEIRHRLLDLAACDVRQTGRLQELLYALHLLASMHMQREEEAFLRRLSSDPDELAALTEQLPA